MKLNNNKIKKYFGNNYLMNKLLNKFNNKYKRKQQKLIEKKKKWLICLPNRNWDSMMISFKKQVLQIPYQILRK